MEGSDTQPFTEQQYDSLNRVSQLLMQHYPELSEKRIAGHSDIAPDRKTDPGPCFDWQHYRKLLHTSVA